MVTFFWLTPIRTGTFDVLCAELCGVGHHTMRSSVVVDDRAAYQKWLQEQETFAMLYPKAAAGAQLAATQQRSLEKTILTAKESESDKAVR